jgi:uncharacterized membrane protein YqjE
MSDLETPTDGRTAGSGSSLGELLSRLTSDFGELVSTQVELAKVEMKEEVGRAGKSAGLLTTAAAAGYLAVALLSWAAAWGLAEVMATGWAFLIVGAVWAIVAAILGTTGRKRLQAGQHMPETTRSIKEDAQWARQQRT